jgi:hypothetical protein
MANDFRSPEELRQFALDTAVMLEHAGLDAAGRALEAAATAVYGTGSEWLGEIGLAVKKAGHVDDPALARRLDRLHRAVRRVWG